jgi:hypothetical protein
LPQVPYYQNLYETLGAYSLTGQGFNEAETLTIEVVRRLVKSPENLDALRNSLGAEKRLFDRTLQVGETGAYLVKRRCRGRDILLSPAYFSENSEVFADIVASKGSCSVRRILDLVKSVQGIPLQVVATKKRIGEELLTDDEIAILKRLAQDGAVKPPSIETRHSGKNYFLFTPTPTGAALPVTKRDIYERAMAIVAAVRQGQFLPKRYAIRSPGAVIWTLKENLCLRKATTEAVEQYRNLVHLRIGRLIPAGSGFAQFKIINTPENREALEIAYSLVAEGVAEGIEVDEDARNAMVQNQEYIESIISSSELRKREKVRLDSQQQLELESLLQGGTFS